MACQICQSITEGGTVPDLCRDCQRAIKSGDWVMATEGREVVVTALSTGNEMLRTSLLTDREVEEAIDWGRRIEESGNALVEKVPFLSGEELKHLWQATQELDRTTMKIRCAIVNHLYNQLAGRWPEKMRYICETLDVSESTAAASLRVARAFGPKLEALEDYPETSLHWGHIAAAARAGGQSALRKYDEMSDHGNRKVPVGEYKVALGLEKPDDARCPYLRFFCEKSGEILASDTVCSSCEVMP